ncbi:MAG: methyltransferase domain-containing protein [Balneolales bacterium]
MKLFFAIPLLMSLFYITNKLSYGYLKRRILERQKWDLNICCGKTDGGGINADIYEHDSIPNFVLTENIYDLPFKDKQFKSILCSHTIEHVDDPYRFYQELNRIGENVVLVIPPLWDISAVFNALEHRWIFLSFKKEHKTLPPHIRLPFSQSVHKRFGQKIRS